MGKEEEKDFIEKIPSSELATPFYAYVFANKLHCNLLKKAFTSFNYQSWNYLENGDSNTPFPFPDPIPYLPNCLPLDTDHATPSAPCVGTLYQWGKP